MHKVSTWYHCFKIKIFRVVKALLIKSYVSCSNYFVFTWYPNSKNISWIVSYKVTEMCSRLDFFDFGTCLFSTYARHPWICRCPYFGFTPCSIWNGFFHHKFPFGADDEGDWHWCILSYNYCLYAHCLADSTYGHVLTRCPSDLHW